MAGSTELIRYLRWREESKQTVAALRRFTRKRTPRPQTVLVGFWYTGFVPWQQQSDFSLAFV
jgi:hypothetical protein